LRATLDIDLQAVQANWRHLRDSLQKGCECAAVVKADAYGLGAAEVVTALLAAGCKTFFVATLNEAIALRASVPTGCTIVVLGGLCHGAPSIFAEHNLVPVLYDISSVTSWANYCRGIKAAHPSVIKIDTGMNRLGLALAELEMLLDQGRLVDECSPIMLMSHLACADTPDAVLNGQQLNLFKQAKATFSVRFPWARYSLANSSGIFLGEHYHFNTARPGAALYGVNPTPFDAQNPMHQVVRLQLPVMQVKTVSKGGSIGYGGTFVAAKDMRIAIVFGGYADGILRLLSSRGHGYYNGHPIPIVGRVSMDSIAYDVSSIPDSDISSGDMVELLGTQGIDALAQDASTIGYEILTSLGRRYRRHYLNVTKGDARV